jgi:hypothetical protein
LVVLLDPQLPIGQQVSGVGWVVVREQCHVARELANRSEVDQSILGPFQVRLQKNPNHQLGTQRCDPQLEPIDFVAKFGV